METFGVLEEGVGVKTDHMSIIRSVDGQGHPWLCLFEYLLLLETQLLPLLHTHFSSRIPSSLAPTKSGCSSTFIHLLPHSNLQQLECFK